MRNRFWLAFVCLVVLTVGWVGAEEISGLPLHVQELGDTVIRLWVGDHISSTAVVAFGTAQGIVVVDTIGIPEVDAELRRVIARELGRSDFIYLINTHEHADHTGGNAVYDDDCIIVGHELVGVGLAQAAERRERMLQWYPNRIAELEQELKALPADDSGRAALREDLILSRLNFGVVQADLTPPAPELTFSDRLTLAVGDTTFELLYIGGMHTASDIAVFVPEHGLLLTGDTMADVWLTDTPGCLASFSVRPGIPHDFPRWLHNWDRLLAERERIDTLLPGHWNGELSMAGAEARVEYVRALWDGVEEAAEAGTRLEDVQAAYRLDTRFPSLVDSPGFDPQRHYASVAELWRVVTNQASAARTVYDLISEGAEDVAIREVVAERDAQTPKYFYVESEFNAYGYAFLQQDKVEEAITLFSINAELYPESWNVYDSLGEALLKAGKTDKGVAMYEKSLALNPENDNGRTVLENIQGG